MGRPSQGVVHVRPFAEHVAAAREIGFEMLYHHTEPRMMLWPIKPQEGVEQTLRLVGIVSIRLEPKTIRAREALRRASDDPLCDGYETDTHYQVVEREHINDPVEIATQDTAVYALSAVREALSVMP